MMLNRISPKPGLNDIELAYRAFLRNTWIAIPAFITFITEIISKTGLAENADGTAKNYDVGAVSFAISYAFLPIMLFVLAFSRGRENVCTIATGRLKIWQVVAFGVILGAIAQFSGRAFYTFLGGEIISANDDSSVIGTILYFAFSVFLIAISEEVMFRLVLQTYLQRYGTAIAVIGTAAIFTVFHLPFFDRVPTHLELLQTCVLVPISALLLSVARRYSGSLLLTLVIHMTDNSLAILGRPDVQIPGCC